MANVVDLSSLRRGNGDGNGGNDDQNAQPNQYYAGGADGHGGGSGLSVIGPNDNGQSPDAVANIIARAREQAGGGAEAAGGDGNQPRHVVTFYREGFTVNDGPYRARSDPANRPFLEAIEQGVVPRELEGENRDEQVEISLVDRRQEDYVAPPPPAYVAFSGEGQTIGSSGSLSADVVVSGATTTAASERPVIDDKKPKTTLQIRLHNGTRLRETLNLDHTIRDIHTIIQLNNAADQAYTLLAGFPPRPIPTQMDQTIKDAGLQGAAVTQKLV